MSTKENADYMDQLVARAEQAERALDGAQADRDTAISMVNKTIDERDTARRALAAARQTWIDEYAKQTETAIQQRDEAWAEFDGLVEERDAARRTLADAEKLIRQLDLSVNERGEMVTLRTKLAERALAEKEQECERLYGAIGNEIEQRRRDLEALAEKEELAETNRLGWLSATRQLSEKEQECERLKDDVLGNEGAYRLAAQENGELRKALAEAHAALREFAEALERIVAVGYPHPGTYQEQECKRIAIEALTPPASGVPKNIDFDKPHLNTPTLDKMPPAIGAQDCGCPPNWGAACEVSPMAGTCPRQPASGALTPLPLPAALPAALADSKPEAKSEAKAALAEWLCTAERMIHPVQRNGILQPCPDCGKAMVPTSPELRRIDELKVELDTVHRALNSANLAWEADQHALHDTRRALIQAEENLVKAEEYLVTAEENFQREYAILRAQLLQAGEALADAHRQIEFLYATMQAMERRVNNDRVNNENTYPTGGV